MVLNNIQYYFFDYPNNIIFATEVDQKLDGVTLI